MTAPRLCQCGLEMSPDAKGVLWCNHCDQGCSRGLACPQCWKLTASLGTGPRTEYRR